MKLATLLLLTLALAACGKPTPAFESTGTLQPGGALVVRNVVGNIEAYGPETGQPPSSYTVDFFGAPAEAPKVAKSGTVVTVTPSGFTPANRYLVRAPKNTTLTISTQTGAVNVEDVDAVVNAETGTGAINLMSYQYANASTGTGNIQATFASTDWSGTLHFSARKGDITVYVNATANARVHLHTDRGSIFTDFPLHGTSAGESETIDGIINAGGGRGVDITTGEGVIRLLQLKPQA